MVLKPPGQTLAKVGDSGAHRQLIHLGQLCIHLLLLLLLMARKIDSSVVPLVYPIDRNHPNHVSSDAN